MCVSKLTIIVSDNGLSPGRYQAIIRTNAGILLIGPLGINFNEISFEIRKFWYKKIIWKCRLRNGGHFVSAPMCWGQDCRYRFFLSLVSVRGDKVASASIVCFWMICCIFLHILSKIIYFFNTIFPIIFFSTLLWYLTYFPQRALNLYGMARSCNIKTNTLRISCSVTSWFPFL